MMHFVMTAKRELAIIIKLIDSGNSEIFILVLKSSNLQTAISNFPACKFKQNLTKYSSSIIHEVELVIRGFLLSSKSSWQTRRHCCFTMKLQNTLYKLKFKCICTRKLFREEAKTYDLTLGQYIALLSDNQFG